VDGYLSGERVNKSLDLQNWTRASEIIRDWEIAGTVHPQERAGTPVSDACDAFLAEVEAQRLSEHTLKKYRVLLINSHTPEELEKFSPSLKQFCAETGVQFTSQLLLLELSRFRGQWKDGTISGGKKLERLQAVGRFFVDRGWWTENWALKLKRPKVTDPPTMPPDGPDKLSASTATIRGWGKMPKDVLRTPLTPAAKLVFAAIAAELYRRETVAMTYNEIGAYCNVGERQVRRSLQVLVAKGLVEQRRLSVGRVYQYRLLHAEFAGRSNPQPPAAETSIETPIAMPVCANCHSPTPAPAPLRPLPRMQGRAGFGGAGASGARGTGARRLA
jgi:hypothetical protein